MSYAQHLYIAMQVSFSYPNSLHGALSLYMSKLRMLPETSYHIASLLSLYTYIVSMQLLFTSLVNKCVAQCS